MTRSAVVVGALLLATSPLLAAKTFSQDDVHTMVGFRAGTVLFDVPGHFDRFKITLTGDPDDLAKAKARVEIETASVNTGNPKRDDHLRSADFFDATQYKAIVFESTKVAIEGGKLLVTGTLDMHGKKETVTIPFDVVQAKNGAGLDTTGYRGSLTLKNSTFGIGDQSVAAKISLKDEVVLDVLLVGQWEAPKAEAAKPAAKDAKGGKKK